MSMTTTSDIQVAIAGRVYERIESARMVGGVVDSVDITPREVGYDITVTMDVPTPTDAYPDRRGSNDIRFAATTFDDLIVILRAAIGVP